MYGDDLSNLELLIQTSIENYRDVNPFTFEPSTGRFLDSEGNELDGDAISLIVRGTGLGAKGAGRTTLQRGAIFESLVRERGGTGGGIGQRTGLLERLVGLARQYGASTRNTFYSRSTSPAVVAKSTAEVEKITTGITSSWAYAPEVVVVYDMFAERQDVIKLFRECICDAQLKADTLTLRLFKASMMSKKYRFVGGLPCLVGVLVLLSGCAVQVVSSSPRTVVIQSGSAQTAEAQQAANAECAQHKLFARLSSKPTPNQFIYDCVN
jgi:hypothetical protein